MPEPLYKDAHKNLMILQNLLFQFISVNILGNRSKLISYLPILIS